jgi:hypothetical protein
MLSDQAGANTQASFRIAAGDELLTTLAEPLFGVAACWCPVTT